MIDCKTCIHGKVCGYRADDEGQEGECSEYLNSADVRRVVWGEWIDTGSGQQCSACGEFQPGYDNYRYFCPVCGAFMRGEDE